MTAEVTAGTQADTTASVKAAPPVVEQGTEYVILIDDTGNHWIKVGTATARNSDDAILKFSADHGNQAGKFVAIPTKRWNPKTITPQTVTTLKLEEAR
jgi:hypothetical protein